jgi:two-component system, LuxR family, response regulator FixJ
VARLTGARGHILQLRTKETPTVIVIEDDLSVRRSLRRLIATAGFSVQTFDRPSTFLESNPPISNVCYVIDIHLPEMTGVALCQQMRALGWTPRVILITGHVDERTLEMTRRANAAAVLFKPFGREQLLEAISTALRSESLN